ncbi:IS1595 family transposase [Croceicoccus naphthovorans]|nr:IS1595 family transposase [Croceicoccus naphthovorans]MBB3991681.1 transposase-like protein [Croceicoccus naphthovorans]
MTDWFHLMLLFTNSRTGISTHFAQRHFGIAQKAAYRAVDRVRTHLALLEGVRMVGGPGVPVYVDETLLNGVRTLSRSGKGKAILMGLTDGDVVTTAIIPDRRSDTLFSVIDQRIRKGSIIVTDSYNSYKRLADLGWARETVNHSKGFWVNESGFSQSRIESYWAVFKRMIRGAHLHVRRDKLWKYVNAFNFCYNRRMRSHETFWDMISAFPEFPPKITPPKELDLVPHRFLDS